MVAALSGTLSEAAAFSSLRRHFQLPSCNGALHLERDRLQMLRLYTFPGCRAQAGIAFFFCCCLLGFPLLSFLFQALLTPFYEFGILLHPAMRRAFTCRGGGFFAVHRRCFRGNAKLFQYLVFWH